MAHKTRSLIWHILPILAGTIPAYTTTMYYSSAGDYRDEYNPNYFPHKNPTESIYHPVPLNLDRAGFPIHSSEERFGPVPPNTFNPLETRFPIDNTAIMQQNQQVLALAQEIVHHKQPNERLLKVFNRFKDIPLQLQIAYGPHRGPENPADPLHKTEEIQKLMAANALLEAINTVTEEEKQESDQIAGQATTVGAVATKEAELHKKSNLWFKRGMSIAVIAGVILTSTGTLAVPGLTCDKGIEAADAVLQCETAMQTTLAKVPVCKLTNTTS